MTQLSLVPEPDGSPFDRIRREDGYGEFWAGRDLMPLMRYAQWRDFGIVIEKARASLALVQGAEEAARHFAEERKTPATGGPAAQDYRLTRFGAYLVAMAGDDTKESVAQARVYFAVKTREAEVAQPPRELTRREMAMAIIEAEDAREAAERELEQARPAIEQHAQFLDTTGSMPLQVVAKALNVGPNRLFAFLRRHRVLISTAGPRFNTPYQDQVEAGRFEVVMGTRERSDGSSEPTYTTRCTAKGQAHIHRLIEKHGRP